MNESFVGIAIFHLGFFVIMIFLCMYYMNKGEL
jgi:hypothetical protein